MRKNDPSDDRIKRLQITPAGTEVLKTISDHKERSVQQYLMKYSDDQKAELLHALRDVLTQTGGKSKSS